MNPTFGTSTKVLPDDLVESEEVCFDNDSNGRDCFEVIGGFD